MRYTTIIDITEITEVYRNPNARLLYLHLVLKSGYHDNDRDLIAISIRNLAWRTGLTLSATRHALKILAKHKLVSKTADRWQVKKWIIEDTITPRAKTKKQQKDLESSQIRRQQQITEEQRSAQDRQERIQLERQGKNSYMVYYEQLVEKAKNGDQDAAAKVEKYRKDYEEQKQAMIEKVRKKH